MTHDSFKSPEFKLSWSTVVSFLQIVIPFFSLLIKDIYFLNEGCASRLPNGHINFEVSERGFVLVELYVLFQCLFECHLLAFQFDVMAPPCGQNEHYISSPLFLVNKQKLWELAKQVSEFLVWRQVVCPFDRDRRILQFLVTTPVFSEDGQWCHIIWLIQFHFFLYVANSICNQFGEEN